MISLFGHYAVIIDAETAGGDGDLLRLVADMPASRGSNSIEVLAVSLKA